MMGNLEVSNTIKAQLTLTHSKPSPKGLPDGSDPIRQHGVQEQAYGVLLQLREPERTLTLLAAGTGLRISECLGCNGRTLVLLKE